MSQTWKTRSALGTIKWPAIPEPVAAVALALQYQLEQSQWWPAAEIGRRQLEQVSVLLDYAYDTLRFWRYRLKAAGYRPGQAIDAGWFATLPFLTRTELQEQGVALLSKAVPRDHGAVVTSQTSGATGRPVVAYDTDLTQLFWRAFTLRDHAWHGRDLAGKLAAIRTGVEAAALSGWGPSTDLAFETGPSVTLNINTDLDTQLAWLREQDPDYVITYSSNLRGLLSRALAAGLRLPRLREVRTYGEALPAELRELCTRAWNVPLVDLYSAQETGYIALQCPLHEHYHLQAENVLVEILDDRNAPCAPGQIGRVVLTNLNNFARPLIRYEIGDFAELGEPCDCGRGLAVLNRIAGRVRNVVTLPDGRQHWASFPASKWGAAAPVTQLQLVQTDRTRMVARVVAARPIKEIERSRLIEALRDCLGHPFDIQVEQVAEIARGPGLKFEEFISLL